MSLGDQRRPSSTSGDLFDNRNISVLVDIGSFTETCVDSGRFTTTGHFFPSTTPPLKPWFEPLPLAEQLPPQPYRKITLILLLWRNQLRRSFTKPSVARGSFIQGTKCATSSTMSLQPDSGSGAQNIQTQIRLRHMVPLPGLILQRVTKKTTSSHTSQGKFRE
jgi:hypothetical protein